MLRRIRVSRIGLFKNNLTGEMMRSTMSMTLASFGVLFLAFGGVMLFLGMLGLHFGSRESLGSAGTVGIPFVIIGIVLFGAGFVTNKRRDS